MALSLSNLKKNVGAVFSPLTGTLSHFSGKKQTTPAMPATALPTPTLGGSNLPTRLAPEKPTVPRVTPAAATPATPAPVTSPYAAINDSLAQVKNQALSIQDELKRMGTTGSTNTASPTAPATPVVDSPVTKAEQVYQESLKISPEELSTQADLDKLIESTKKAYAGTSDQAIPMEFITGQLASIERRALNLAEPLERKLARMQAARTSAIESSKFALDRAEKVAENAKPKSPVSVGAGSSLVDPTTGKVVYTAPKESEQFTLGKDQVRYDAQGNVIARGASGTSGGGGTDSGGTEGLNLSPAAQNIIALINKGAEMDTLIKGTSREAQALRNEVYRGLAEQGGRPDTVVDLFKEGKEIVDDMLNSGDYKAIGGWSTRLGGQWGTRYGDAMAKAQQLSAILAKDNLGLLKGAMSDKDLEFINSMSTGFQGAGIQSEKYIQDRLTAIQKKLATKISESGAGTTGKVIVAPDGTEVEITD